ncbi:hypothetical protein N8T08_010479 [Aspergillus melleus]|uniref:Uncharacterized protein n=1 Tax=Aspergillus melleus TaxID=138277 RepID=A0ACC3ASJ1_9EURO|nr:hypothetical protein N8T08_010479 [Aspergillus melleus]
MTVAESVKSAVGLADTTGMFSLAIGSSKTPFPAGDVRCPPPYSVPGFLCTPLDSLEPMPAARVLPSLEVRGMTFAICAFYRYCLLLSLLSFSALLFAFSKYDERHSYEKCQYDEFKKRVAKMDELRAAKDGARSN